MLHIRSDTALQGSSPAVETKVMLNDVGEVYVQQFAGSSRGLVQSCAANTDTTVAVAQRRRPEHRIAKITDCERELAREKTTRCSAMAK